MCERAELFEDGIYGQTIHPDKLSILTVKIGHVVCRPVRNAGAPGSCCENDRAVVVGGQSEVILNCLRFRRFNLYGGGLADEIQAQQHLGHIRAFLQAAFYAAQRAGFDYAHRRRSDLRCKTDRQVRFHRLQDTIVSPVPDVKAIQAPAAAIGPRPQFAPTSDR